MFEEDFVSGQFERELEKLKERTKKEANKNKKNNDKSEKINFWDVKQSIHEKNKENSNCLTDFLN